VEVARTVSFKSKREATGVAKVTARARKAEQSPLPALQDIAPELATLVAQAPSDGGWIYETKYDGYRILARVQNGQVALVTRNGNDFTARAPKVAQALAALAADGLVLDGELVSPPRQANGGALSAGDFQALQNALREGRSGQLLYYVFDCLFLAGEDIRPLPLTQRKQLLARVLPKDRGVLRRSRHLRGSGAELLQRACELGFEGIIAKRASAPYRAGRGKDWLKLKCSGREEFVIVGFTPPAGARTHLGALLLATRERAGGPLNYAGKVGTGFSVTSLRELGQRLLPLRRSAPACENPPRGHEAKGAQWVEPRLVAEVSFSELTSDGRLRHPSFHGMREDKPASAVHRERRLRTPDKERAQ
jgi:bifunctional non-homologous end joining protein LigD